jgi:APA family basic amino acid/polyamine antiporter
LAAWAVGGAIAVLGALCYGALAARLQESGGEYLFLSRTMHPAAGFLAGWISLLAGFGGAIAFAAEAMQTYLAPWLPAWLPLDLVGSVVIVGAGVLHAGGLKPAVTSQNAAVVVKLVLLVALAAWGLAAIADIPPAVDPALAPAALAPAALAPTAPPPFAFGAFAATLMWISLSYSGWNAAVYVAGEVRDPRRAVPRSMLLGTLLVTTLYLALNTVFVYAAPVAQLAGRPDIAAVAAEALGGEAARDTLRILMTLAMLTSVASMTMIGPRVYAKMADDGMLPRFLAFAGEVPRAAIALQVVVALMFLWLSGLREQLANLGWLLGLCTAASVYGLLRLRRRLGAAEVPIPGYPLVPLLFVAATLFLAVMLVVVQGAELLPAGCVLLSGAVAYRFVGKPA